MYKVVVVDKSGPEFDGISEIIVVRESRSAGKYGARLEPTTGAAGYIVVMVAEQ